MENDGCFFLIYFLLDFSEGNEWIVYRCCLSFTLFVLAFLFYPFLFSSLLIFFICCYINKRANERLNHFSSLLSSPLLSFPYQLTSPPSKSPQSIPLHTSTHLQLPNQFTGHQEACTQRGDYLIASAARRFGFWQRRGIR